MPATIRSAAETESDFISGGDGNDQLNGNDGIDTVNGGGGEDIVNGGAGNDALSGGGGTDKFVFDTALDASTNVDTILFDIADDTIVLDQSIFTAISTGTLTNAAFFTGSAAHDADDRIIYDKTTGSIYYDADGNGAGAQVLFAQVNAGQQLTNTDFLIVA